MNEKKLISVITVVKNCEIKLIELRGAIAALEEIQKGSTEEEKATPVIGSVVPNT